MSLTTVAIPIIGVIIEKVTGIIDKLIVDKDKAAEIKAQVTQQILSQQHELMMGQIDTNKIEAATTGIYKGGWRPFIGWVCGLALFWNFMGYDLVSCLFAFIKPFVPSMHDFTVPKLAGSENLLEVVFAMLGLAGFRTWEKSKGVDATCK